MVVAREVDQLDVLALLDGVAALLELVRRLIGRDGLAVVATVVLLWVVGFEVRGLGDRDRQVRPADDEGGVHRGARLRVEEGLVLLVVRPTAGLVVLVGGRLHGHVSPASLRSRAPLSGALGVPVPLLTFASSCKATSRPPGQASACLVSLTSRVI